jgi:K+-sensing histidine kinase KdpD
VNSSPASGAVPAFEHALITASHELRTPLTVVYGVLQTLQRPANEVGTALRGELVAAAVQQVERMMAVVDEITSRGEEIAHASYADHMQHTA